MSQSPVRRNGSTIAQVFMQAFPHHYTVSATAATDGDVTVSSERLPSLRCAPPTEFGGPGDRWSPETLLVASVADCFVLNFRLIAMLSKLSWISLECQVEATVDRVERVTQFTAFVVHARLRVAEGTDEARAQRIMAKAEETCLVTRSLKAPSHLDAEVEFVSADPIG